MGVQFGSRSIALVAKALSDTYGVNVEIGGSTAATKFGRDGSVTICIPAVDSDDSDYRTLLRGWVDHEAGHVRFTNHAAGCSAKGATHTIANIYEDVFVERRMGKCFPGCARNLHNLASLMFKGVSEQERERYREIAEKRQRGELVDSVFAESVYVTTINFLLYSVRGHTNENIRAHVQEYRELVDMLIPGITEALDPIISRVPSEGNSTETNVSLAKETVKILRKFIAEMNNKNENGGSEQGSDDEPKDGQDNGEPKDGQDNGSQSEGLSKEFDAVLNNDGEVDTDLSNMAVKEINRECKDICNKSGLVINNMTVDDCVGCYIRMLADDEYMRALKTSAALDAQLQSLIQSHVLNRAGAARVGRLDTNKLHRLAVGNDRIFNRRTEKIGVNTEVILVVDMSGSMKGEKAKYTSMALYAILRSLRKIQGCTSSAIGFSGNRIISILDSDTPLTKMMRLVCAGGTQCGEALTEALFRLKPDMSRKIVIMLTDGETRGEEYFKRAIASAKNSGVEFLGVGIVDPSIKNYLNDKECCVISNVEELTGELFRLLRGKLLSCAA